MGTFSNTRPSLTQPCIFCGRAIGVGHEINTRGDLTCPDGAVYTYEYRKEQEKLTNKNIPPPYRAPTPYSLPPTIASLTYNYVKQPSPNPVNQTYNYNAPCPTCDHSWDTHGIISSVCYDCPDQRCQPAVGSPPPGSMQDPTTAKLTGVGSPALDKFLTAMLRSSGGSLTIYPADGELMEGERLCVTRFENPERVVYELRSEDDDEGHVRDGDTG